MGFASKESSQKELPHNATIYDNAVAKAIEVGNENYIQVKSTHKCPYCPVAFGDYTSLLNHFSKHVLRRAGNLIIKPDIKRRKSKVSKHEVEKVNPVKTEGLKLCKVMISRCDKLFSQYGLTSKGQRMNKLCLNIKKGLKSRFHKPTKEKGNACISPKKRPIKNSAIINKCDICEKVFANKGNAARHINAVHKKLRPFECVMCYQLFSNAQNLERHLRFHTQEKPYECSFCLESFAQSPRLKYHIKKAHGIFKN